jgi:hypothetical protein
MSSHPDRWAKPAPDRLLERCRRNLDAMLSMIVEDQGVPESQTLERLDSILGHFAERCAAMSLIVRKSGRNDRRSALREYLRDP